MSSNNLYNIKDIYINVSNRRKRGVYIPQNIIDKVNRYSKMIIATEHFAQAFDQDTGDTIKSLILKHIYQSQGI